MSDYALPDLVCVRGEKMSDYALPDLVYGEI